MEIRKLFCRFGALVLALVILACQLPTVFAAEVGIGIQDMIDAQIANPGAIISHEAAKLDYQFFYGNFANGTLFPFETASGDYLYQGNADDPTNAVWKWQWRCNAGSDTVLKITAKENMYLKCEIQEGGQFHAGWAVGTSFRFVQERGDGDRREVKKITVAAEALSVEDSTAATHLAAGESLYIVYSGSGLMTTDFCPWFTVNTDAYDESQNPFVLMPEAPAVTEDSANFSSLVSETVFSGGAAIEKPMATYQFLYGDMDADNPELKAFTKLEGEGRGDVQDVIYDDASAGVDTSMNGLWRWQWRCCGDTETVLKIVAKEDLVLRVYTQETFTDAWATHSAFRFLSKDSEGLQLVTRSMDVTVVMEPDYCETVVHMAKGDTLYIAYGIMNGDSGTATATYYPQFELKSEGYDAAQRPAFDTVHAVKALKEETITKLQNKYTEFMGDGTIYSTSRRFEMEAIRDDAINGLKDLSTEADINALYNEAVAKMEAIPTQAEENAELDAYKDQKKAELEAEFTKDMYSAKNWTTVEGFLTQAKADIDAAKSAAVVNTVVAKAKANINTVEKGGAATGGLLWGLIGGVALVLVAAAVVVVIVLKKKGAKKA